MGYTNHVSPERRMMNAIARRIERFDCYIEAVCDHGVVFSGSKNDVSSGVVSNNGSYKVECEDPRIRRELKPFGAFFDR